MDTHHRTPMPESGTPSKLQAFLQWLQANGAELRDCTIRPCGSNKGFGVFSSSSSSSSPFNPKNGVVMAVPLDLAITPMRVLQDPVLGPTCRAMFDQGGVDDRFLVMLFLLVESVRPDSLWKPYFDMLPRKFGSPLWFTDEELSELKGTTLYRATTLQRKSLQDLYDNKVKGLVEELLQSHQLERTREIQYEDFLWANSVFWTRALNIPMPHSYVFPKSQEEHGTETSHHEHDTDHQDSDGMECNCGESGNGEPIWVEGLVPAIDFCNHGSKAVATWEVDSSGTMSGIPNSMYLLLAEKDFSHKEINISYGNKGNEELLYLYGFVIDENPDDYLMVHYPVEALEHISSADKKSKLLEIQSAEMRCLLPKTLLDNGFFSTSEKDHGTSTRYASELSNFSWSGERKAPSYLNRLVFPEEFMATLRTISMKDFEIDRVASLLAEVSEPSDKEVQAAIWEVCGDLGAFELLVDLLSSKLMGLEEGSGTDESDSELLEKFNSEPEIEKERRRNYQSSLIYRRGQKQLTKLFLREAQHILALCAEQQY